MRAENKEFYKTLFSLTVVIALQNVISFGVNLADSVMLGNYSESALSGAAAANQVQFLLQMLTGGIGEGIVVLGSQYWGKREAAPIRAVVSAAVAVGLSLSVILSVSVLVFPTEIMRLLTDKESVVREGAAYIRIVGFSYAPFCLTYTLIAAMRSVQTVRLGLFVASAALCINVAGNYALIFGKFGFPEMGSRGAAAATLISRAVELAIVVLFVFFRDDKVRLKVRDLLTFNKVLFGDYIRVGMPVIVSGVIWALGAFVQTAILGRLESESVIAANSAAVTIFQIFSVVVYGLASASGIIIGKTVGESAKTNGESAKTNGESAKTNGESAKTNGENNLDKVKGYTKRLQLIFLMAGIVTGVLTFMFREPILGVYGKISDEARTLAVSFIAVLSVTVVGTAYQMSCLTGIVRGGGDTKFVLVNDMIFVWLVVIPSSYLAAFVFNLPPVVVFCCLKCDQILKCFVAVVHVNRYKWIKKLTR